MREPEEAGGHGGDELPQRPSSGSVEPMDRGIPERNEKVGRGQKLTLSLMAGSRRPEG